MRAEQSGGGGWKVTLAAFIAFQLELNYCNLIAANAIILYNQIAAQNIQCIIFLNYGEFI